MRPAFSKTPTTRLLVVACSIGASLAAGSAAASNYLVGGSSFSAAAYVGTGYLTPSPAARWSTQYGGQPGVHMQQAAVSNGSLLGTYHRIGGHVKFALCQGGVGFLKNALNLPPTGACADYGVGSDGLGTWGGRNWTTTPNFIVTEAPYSTSDYDSFLVKYHPGKDGIAQFPTIAGAVAFPHGDSIDNVALKNYQLCKIYSGVIRNWSSIPGVTGTGKTGPITIVYHEEASGATFALTSYLATTCNGSANVPAGFAFTPAQRLNDALPGGVRGVFGARAVSANGDPTVVQAVLDPANPNALGYADTGNVVALAAGYATVNGFDPTQFGHVGGSPAPLTINPDQLLAGKVLDGSTPNDVPGSVSPTIASCMLVVDPTYQPRDTYPIFAVSYFDSYYSHSTRNVREKLTFLIHYLYTATERPALPAGFAYLDGNSLFGKKVKDAATTCISS